jgi:hypothetical protein
MFRGRGISVFSAIVAVVGAGALGLASRSSAAQISAGEDVFETKPGDASVTLNFGGGPVAIPLEGAEFSAPGTDPFYPLTAVEVTRLNTLAPNLNTQYQLQWTNPHASVVGPTSSHQVTQVLAPVVNTTPNFDTVIQRINSLTFTAGGQVQETPIQILMLNLQSVAPVLVGGFHYELVSTLANGSPVYDPTNLGAPQYKGNLNFDSTTVNGSGVSGTLDLGVTGPTPTNANLGADLPGGMLGLPVDFDIQFIPLDGGPAINPQQGEVIFQNRGASSFGPNVPEPASVMLIAAAGLAAAGGRRFRRTGAR